MSPPVEDIPPNTTEMKAPLTPPHDPVERIPAAARLVDNIPTLRLPGRLSTGASGIGDGPHIVPVAFNKEQQKLDLAIPESEPNNVARPIGNVSGRGISTQNLAEHRIFESVGQGDGLNRGILPRHSVDKLRDLTAGSESLVENRLSPAVSERPLSPDLSSSSAIQWYTSLDEPQSTKLDASANVRRHTLRHQSYEPSVESKRPRNLTIDVNNDEISHGATVTYGRPPVPRALSTPASVKSPLPPSAQEHRKFRAASRSEAQVKVENSVPRASSPMPASIPLPPLSLSTYLQLELSSHRPSPIYIHQSVNSSFPYESSAVKIERLLNFLLLPFHLEGMMWFGVLGCLDAWLGVFTILPLRMLKSTRILVQSWCRNLKKEVCFVLGFVYAGTRRVWRRRRTRRDSAITTAPAMLNEDHAEDQAKVLDQPSRSQVRNARHHKRTKSTPSNLLPDNKADILKGFLIICTCLVLLRLDASRMYHWVRGQAAIKLYVIYNLLEVCDRQLSAIGQDVLECLFSQESLERKPDGHSKVLRPFWLFLLAWLYCVIHATALFYQVITMNVAVNSYSSALITLLMSNQFTEIKSTIFKKFEKENLFQLTCADIVERFQLWHMLMIIASRNIIETGALNDGLTSLMSATASATSPAIANATHGVPPRSASSVLPKSFMIMPEMLSSITLFVPTLSHVLGPFVIVLGSEMVIDWLKHAYINKFNNTRPVIYDRFLDVLCKDYYTNAFGNQNLIKRLGLPVIPLSCLMIRAGFQTYQMFLASWVPVPAASTAARSLADVHQHYSATRAMPTSTAGLLVRKMDDLLNTLPTTIWNSTMTTYFTTSLVILLLFLILLTIKLLLGMGLLFISRRRYQEYKKREQHASWYIEGGKRVGGWGVVEVDEEKKRWFYAEDPAGYAAMKQRDAKEKAKKDRERGDGYGIQGLEKVMRYDMVAKRIW